MTVGNWSIHAQMKVWNVSATNTKLVPFVFSAGPRDDLLNRPKAGWRDHFIAIERTILHRRWPARSKVPFPVGKWWVVSELVSREIALERFIGTSIVRQIDYSGSSKRVYRGREGCRVRSYYFAFSPSLSLSLLFGFLYFTFLVRHACFLSPHFLYAFFPLRKEI